VLPSSKRHGWLFVPTAEPGSRTIAFPAVYDGVHVLVSATAHNDQISLDPVPGKRLEVSLEVWMTVAPFLTAVALSLPPDPPHRADDPQG
jgi:hypothetical protein